MVFECIFMIILLKISLHKGRRSKLQAWNLFRERRKLFLLKIVYRIIHANYNTEQFNLFILWISFLIQHFNFKSMIFVKIFHVPLSKNIPYFSVRFLYTNSENFEFVGRKVCITCSHLYFCTIVLSTNR